MDIQSKIEHYKETFIHDPLFRNIQTAKLMDLLFEDELFYDSVSFNISYSSRHAAELLNIPGKEQTLLNYINRNDLNAYLDVARQARFYRYDWKSLFKFKMVLLLSDNGFTPREIATFIGTKVEVSSEDSSNSYDEKLNPLELNPALEKSIEKLIAIQSDELISNMQNYEYFKNRKHEFQFEKLTLEQKLLQYKEKIEVIDDRVDDMNNYLSLFKSTYQANNQKSEGLFARLFGKTNGTQEKNNDEFEQQIKMIESKKHELGEKRVILHQESESVQSELDKILLDLEKLSKNNIQDINLLKISKGSRAN